MKRIQNFLELVFLFSFEHFRLSSYLGTNCKIFLDFMQSGAVLLLCCFWLTNSSSRGVTISFPEWVLNYPNLEFWKIDFFNLSVKAYRASSQCELYFNHWVDEVITWLWIVVFWKIVIMKALIKCCNWTILYHFLV